MHYLMGVSNGDTEVLQWANDIVYLILVYIYVFVKVSVFAKGVGKRNGGWGVCSSFG